MNRIIKVVILFSAMFMSVSSYADTHDKRNAKITAVYTNSNGLMLIKVEGISGYLSLGQAGDRAAEIMHSTALAAKISGISNVWVRYYDVTSGYPTVGIVSIE